jgi:intein/homing endonuclease
VSGAITGRLQTAFKVIAVSRFGQRELKRNGIDSFYIPHGCLAPETKVSLEQDSIIGLVKDNLLPLRVYGVHRVLLKDWMVKLKTKTRELKITRDQEVLKRVEAGTQWVPAGDLKQGDHIAILPDEALYTSMDIKAIVDLYEKMVLGRRKFTEESLQKRQVERDRYRSGPLRDVCFEKIKQTGAIHKKGIFRGILDGGGKGDTETTLSDYDAEGPISALTGENKIFHSNSSRSFGVEGGKTLRDDLQKALSSIAHRGGVGLPSGIDRWRRDPEDSWEVSPNIHNQLLHAITSLPKGENRGMYIISFKSTIFKTKLPLGGLGELHLRVDSGNPSLAKSEERNSGTDYRVWQDEEETILPRSTIGARGGDKDKNKRLKYEEILSTEPYTPENPWVYDLTTSSGNFVANGIIVHNCRTDVFKPLDRAFCRRLFFLDPDEFVVGIVALNRARKMLAHQLRGYRLFTERNPDIKGHLFLWTDVRASSQPELEPGISDVSVNLLPEIMELGLGEAVRWPEDRVIREGIPDDAGEEHPNEWDMAKLYNCFDVLLLCMPPYERVIASWNSGGWKHYYEPKRIGTVKVGDMVLTHKGRMRRVTKTYRHRYKGELIRIYPLYMPPFTLTPDHPVLVRRQRIEKGVDLAGNLQHLGAYSRGYFEWLPASQIAKNDMVVVPKPKGTGRKYSLTFSRNYPKHPTRHDLPHSVRIDGDLMRYIGYYLAEGCSNKEGVLFSLGPNDSDIARNIFRITKEKFGLDVKERQTGDPNKRLLSISSTRLGRIFSHHFGKNSHQKRLPPWVFEITDQRHRLFPELLRGLWDGDGWMGKKAEYTTVSARLAYHMFMLMLKLGFMPSIERDSKRKAYRIRLAGRQYRRLAELIGDSPIQIANGKRITRNRFRRGKDYFYVPVEKVERVPYDGWVYNLQVEEDESYATPVCLHNCSGGEGFGLPLVEAQACGKPVITTEYAAGPEQVGAGLTVPYSNYVVLNTPGTRYALADLDKMAEAIAKIANADPAKLAKRARAFAERYEWGRVMTDYWEPFLESCEVELRPKVTRQGVSKW